MSNAPSSGSDGNSPAPRPLPARPSLEHLRKQAKDLLRDARSGDASAIARITAVNRNVLPSRIMLADAQLEIGRAHV